MKTAYTSYRPVTGAKQVTTYGSGVAVKPKNIQADSKAKKREGK